MKRAMSRYREVLALEMAAQGQSYEAIAAGLGFADRSGAWRAVWRALGRHEARAADEYRSWMLAELDMVQEAAWPGAMSGDLVAGVAVLRAIEARSRLLGV
jgi:hypothetical protein